MPERNLKSLVLLTDSPIRKLKNTFIIGFLLILFSFLFNFCSPSDKQTIDNREYRRELSSLFYRTKDIDSLEILLQTYLEDGNDVAAMLCYKQLGRNQRDNAFFADAISSHQEGLNLAIKLKDTLEIVQALNNLGTNFRRIGALSEASDYHYRALGFAESYSEANSEEGLKSRVVSMNGIGNISLTLGYYEDAEKYFRNALREEVTLESAIGQAINYANLGAIFELREEIDSARYYYNLSMDQNKIAKSDMGIGLCLIHLGDLYKKEAKYDLAKDEYIKAYDLMEQISDRWHWLEACISIAQIHLLTQDFNSFNNYIDMAEKTAVEINSPEHLATIYNLKHDYFVNRNQYQTALDNFKKSMAMQDSVQGVQNSVRYMDLRVNYEREKNERFLQLVEAENKAIQAEKQRELYITWFFSILGILMTGLLYYAYRQRTRSNKLLKELEKTRSDFFTNIAHEFRTPLTVIMGFNNLLKERRELGEKEKNVYLTAIERQSNSLLNMINQLLDMAKLQAGKADPDWKNGDIVSYLRMIAETFKLFAEEKKINLVFYSEFSSLKMDFVPFYIEKIVSNLLSNAIKHSNEGDRINFIVGNGTGVGTIAIKVADNGDGIASEDLKNIFDLFYQSRSRKSVGGSGIGLSFTKLLVEKMNGTIKVDSQLGEGATFTVMLPMINKQITNITPIDNQVSTYSLSTADEILGSSFPEIETGDEKEEEIVFQKPVVLVVEDNKDISAYIQTLLADKYTVIMARNGKEGNEMAESQMPDLIVTDVMMPVMDGIELCCIIKHSELLNHIPVIMLTAKSSDKDRIEGLKCGADAYIPKPFQPEELFVQIDRLLENRRILKEKYMTGIYKEGADTVKDMPDKFIIKVNELIHKKLTSSSLTPSFMAENLSMSVSQLNRKLNAVTGYPAASYILQIKLSQAIKLLSNSDKSVSEVADSCGFYDIAYFSRTFKKFTGRTPTQFQQQKKS